MAGFSTRAVQCGNHLSTRVGVAVVLCLAGSGPAAAQVEGTVRGTVRDAVTGQGIPRVAVTLRPTDRQVISDSAILRGEELIPPYLRAALDFLQPLFAYGPPRIIRLGVQLEF